MNPTVSFYSRPSYVSGAGSIYTGARRQRGGSIFGALKSIVTPLISTVGKSLGRNALKNVAGFAGDVVGDLSRGTNLKHALINRGKERGLKTLQQTFTSSRQKKTPKRMNVKRKRKRKQRGGGKKRTLSKSKKRHSRKRRAHSKHSSSAKRRRCHNF